MKCMKQHHPEKVIFASQESELMGAMLRPRTWPNFRFQL